MPSRRPGTSLLFALVAPLLFSACVGGVNGSVNVPAGTSVTDASTVNGSVHVEAKATAGKAESVNGSVELADGAHVDEASTVNGHVTLAARASAGKIHTVNGAITLGEGATVAGSATAVNGALSLAPGSAVNGRLANVNSNIRVDAAHVGGGIKTVSGDIDITGNAVVDGGITVAKPSDLGIQFGSDVPRITIGPGATVNGPLTFEREVKLYISNDAHVTGPITGAQAIKFSGTTPPAS